MQTDHTSALVALFIQLPAQFCTDIVNRCSTVIDGAACDIPRHDRRMSSKIMCMLSVTNKTMVEHY